MEHVFVSLTWERAELLNLGLKCWLGPEFLTNSNQSSDRRMGLCFILRRIIEFEEYLPNELWDQTDFLFQSSLLPYHFCDLRQVSLQTLWASGRVKWEPPGRGNLKLHNCSPEDFIQCQVWMGKERSLCSRLYFPCTAPTSWHLNAWTPLGTGTHSDPQGCLPYVDLKTCLCVTSFAHTDLSSSPVLQIGKDSLILSLL